MKLGNFQNGKNKIKHVYLLTPVGVVQKMVVMGRFLKRKMNEYEALKAEIESMKAEGLEMSELRKIIR